MTTRTGVRRQGARSPNAILVANMAFWHSERPPKGKLLFSRSRLVSRCLARDFVTHVEPYVCGSQDSVGDQCHAHLMQLAGSRQPSQDQHRWTSELNDWSQLRGAILDLTGRMANEGRWRSLRLIPDH